MVTIFLFSLAIFADQYVKSIFLNGYRYENSIFSLVLVYNKGVAFSMFSFLNNYLKWMQIILVIVVSLYVYLVLKKRKYYLPFALLLGSAVSNIIDRFVHGSVVDFFYWHYIFNFAIFNLADVFINISILWIVIATLVCKDKNL